MAPAPGLFTHGRQSGMDLGYPVCSDPQLFLLLVALLLQALLLRLCLAGPGKPRVEFRNSLFDRNA